VAWEPGGGWFTSEPFSEPENFEYRLGAAFIAVLEPLRTTGMDSTTPGRVGGVEMSPRDVVAAVLPDPAGLAS